MGRRNFLCAGRVRFASALEPACATCIAPPHRSGLTHTQRYGIDAGAGRSFFGALQRSWWWSGPCACISRACRAIVQPL